MKYKIKQLTKMGENNTLLTDAVALDEALELEFRECKNQQELTEIFQDMSKKNLYFVARRDIDKWGAILYFGEKEFIKKT